jgi:hypothetical protein
VGVAVIASGTVVVTVIASGTVVVGIDGIRRIRRDRRGRGWAVDGVVLPGQPRHGECRDQQAQFEPAGQRPPPHPQSSRRAHRCLLMVAAG